MNWKFYMERRDRGLIKNTTQTLVWTYWGKPQKVPVRITGFRVEIRTRYLPKQKCQPLDRYGRRCSREVPRRNARLVLLIPHPELSDTGTVISGWSLRFSLRWRRWWWSTWLWSRTILSEITDVSEERTASIFRIIHKIARLHNPYHHQQAAGAKPCITLCSWSDRRGSRWVVRDITFNRGNRVKFTAVKVPRQCPLVLLVKVGRREVKIFGCEEGRDERWSREISGEGRLNNT
jgi:hypothetical protein